MLEMSSMEVHGPGDGRRLEQALDIADELGDLNLQGGVRSNLGVLNLYAGDGTKPSGGCWRRAPSTSGAAIR